MALGKSESVHQPARVGLTALERGFEDARWLTYLQAQSRGSHVRRGERGMQVVLWKWIERAQ